LASPRPMAARETRFSRKDCWCFAQLRDVLAAKDSAVVAKENQDGGIVFQKRAEAD